MNTVIIAVSVALLAQTTPAARNTVDVVAVAGCLREVSAESWMLAQATDPVVSTANAPSAKELQSFAKSGKHEFQLTGVSVFNLPAHRGHHVLVKGLLNKAIPISRLNITSVTMISAECPPK